MNIIINASGRDSRGHARLAAARASRAHARLAWHEAQ